MTFSCCPGPFYLTSVVCTSAKEVLKASGSHTEIFLAKASQTGTDQLTGPFFPAPI